jgi:predicted nucleotidyltransferase
VTETAGRPELDEMMDRVRAWCEQRPVRLCVLFGSQVTGRGHPESDIDLAVWPAKTLAPAEKLRWIGELQALLDSEVSLVLVSPELDPVLGMEIVRHGVVVFEAEPEIWFEKRLDLWHTYNDALPFLRAQFAAVGEFAREVRRGS